MVKEAKNKDKNKKDLSELFKNPDSKDIIAYSLLGLAIILMIISFII